MKSISRKALTLLLSAVMILSVGMSAFAATAPSSSDTAAVKVYGVESGVTVTAYQIVTGTYNSYGLTGYTTVSGVSIADLSSPTASEITAIANALNKGTLSLTSQTLTTTGTDSTGYYYSARLGAGTWLILVSDAGSTIYNPMIVSNGYTDANDASTLTAGTISADGSFEEGSNAVYAKKTTTSVDKEITNADNGNENGASFNIGDTVSFEITSTFPDYSDAYYNAVFTITDTMSEGLDPVSAADITVKVGGFAVTAGTDTYSVSVSGQVITVSFVPSYILANANEDISITYSTVLNENAVIGETGGNTNDVTLEYSNETGTDSDGNPYTTTTDEPDGGTNIYTFAASLYKVSEDGTASASGGNVSVTDPLSDAVFTIYTDEDLTQVYTNGINSTGTAVSGSTGEVTFEGLKEGTYYIIETDAADGYALTDIVYTLVIAAEYNTDGTVSSYTTSFTDSVTQTTRTNTYKASYNSDGSYKSTQYDLNPTAVINTALTTLPFTGSSALMVLTFASLGTALLSSILLGRRKHA